MPEKAKVFLVEDARELMVMAEIELEEHGHAVPVKARTLKHALKLVPRLRNFDVSVAVLDGNLSEDDATGEDGRQIANAIREQHPDIKIIEWSFSHSPYGWGDGVADKSSIGSRIPALALAVTEA